MHKSSGAEQLWRVGVCASPYWPPFTEAIVEVARVGYATSLWQCVHGYDTEQPLQQWYDNGERFDCILGVLRTAASVRHARHLAPHVISLSSNLPPADGIHYVQFDAEAIGRMAAEHLLERKITAAAFFCPQQQHCGLLARGAAFAACLGEAGVPYLGSFSSFGRKQAHLLAEHSGPVGLFAADDQSASQLATSLAERNIPIPYKAMVLGVNDQEYLCHFGPVPLSSIRLDGIAMGNACVELLKHLAFGNGTGAAPIVAIPPLGVTVRTSTEPLLMGDDLAGRALALLRKSPHVPGDVNAWAGMASTSRRPLERSLRQVLNRTPKQLLDAERVRRAIQLLRSSNHGMERIAEMSGFSSARHLRETLQRVDGRSPTTVRHSGST
jgi:LacI family transcriptional regulator